MAKNVVMCAGDQMNMAIEVDGLDYYARFALPTPPPRRRKNHHRWRDYERRESRCRADLSAFLRVAVLVGGLSSSKDITGSDRRREITEWRHAIYLAAWRRGHSLSLIGRLMGRDHTTIRSAVMRAEAARNDSWSTLDRHVLRLEAGC